MMKLVKRVAVFVFVTLVLSCSTNMAVKCQMVNSSTTKISDDEYHLMIKYVGCTREEREKNARKQIAQYFDKLDTKSSYMLEENLRKEYNEFLYKINFSRK